ncbi:MAG TPA: hypothetical protein VFT71_07945 [Candidatus Nitrosocosmicus sp.]|nr:hypothetical protein [Candidatus Nitrosocosmicus sp.]
MKYKFIALLSTSIAITALVLITSSVNDIAAQPEFVIDERPSGLLSTYSNEIVPKKVILFNTNLTKEYNETEINESIEETYASNIIPIVDINYSIPSTDLIVPNATVLDQNDTLIANSTSFFDCKTCYKTYVPINNLQSDIVSVIPENISLISRNQNLLGNLTVPIMFTNDSHFNTLPEDDDGGFINMTDIPQVLDHNMFNVTTKKIQFTSSANTSTANMYKSLVAEPTIAKKNDTLIFVNNYYFARSLDDGESWTLLDMKNDSDIDICCDNRVIYDKDHDIFIWYAQGEINKTQENNVNRLGVSRDGISWIMYYFNQQDIWPSRTSFVFDFPHIVAGNKYLYLFTAVVQERTENMHQIVIRFPLNELSKCDPSTTGSEDLQNCKTSFDYYLSKKRFNFTPIYNVEDTIYWATFITNNLTRIYQWNENSTSIEDIRPFDMKIPAFSFLQKNNTVCDPQSTEFQSNWCLRTDSRILTGWKHDNLLGFFWNADSKGENELGKKFPFPYIDGATFLIKEDGLKTLGRPYIYNSGTPFLYPAVNVNANGEIGLVAYYGDEVLKPSIIFGTTKNISENMPWDIQIIKKSTHIPQVDISADDILAWGDFITLQPEENSWYGTAIVMEGGNTTESVQPYYIKIQKNSP